MRFTFERETLNRGQKGSELLPLFGGWFVRVGNKRQDMHKVYLEGSVRSLES